MTPFENFRAVVGKKFAAILEGAPDEGIQGLVDGRTDRVEINVEAIAAVAEAIKAFHLEYRNHPSKRGGEPTGKIAVAGTLWTLFRVCETTYNAPPAELVDALFVWLDLDRPNRKRRGEIQSEKYNKLAYYYIDNPNASQRKAAKDTGISRSTVQKYMAEPGWWESVEFHRKTRDRYRENGLDYTPENMI